jgi:hypothetical protein
MGKKDSATLCLVLLLTFSSIPIMPLQAGGASNESTIFSDNFDSYAVGTFPSSAGWQLLYDGMGSQYQVISSQYSKSSPNSLQLWGNPNDWSATTQKAFSRTNRYIGYEVSMMISQIGNGGPGRVDYVGFYNKDIGSWGRHYATIQFNHDTGKIIVDDGSTVGSWTVGTWYTVKVLLDTQTKTYSVWVDSQAKGTTYAVGNQDVENINALQLQSDHPGAKDYFDNVRVFEIEGTDGNSGSNSLAGYWNFDEGVGTTASDSSGNSHNGAINGPTYASGLANTGLKFDGINDYVEVPNSPQLNTQQFSVMAFVKLDKLPTVNDYTVGGLAHPNQMLVSMGTNDLVSGYFGLSICRDPPSATPVFQFYLCDNSQHYIARSTINPTTAAWYHIAGTYDGTTLKLYINGNLEAQKTISITRTSNSGNIQFGALRKTSYQYWLNGTLDEVKIYNYARSLEQIGQDYGQNTPTNNALVGCWNFDEGTGTAAYDSSGYGNTATLVNGAKYVDGIKGKAVYCDGADDYVSIAENADLDPHTSDWTISVWVNIAKTNPDMSKPQFVIVTKRNVDSSFSLTLMVQGRTSESMAKFAFMLDGAPPSTIAGAESPLMNVLGWHNVVGVRTGSDLYVYVDGIGYGPDNVKGLGDYITSTTNVDSSSPVHLCHHGAWNRYYNGTVDELKIYNYARNAQQIADDYDGVIPVITPTPNPTPIQELRSNWAGYVTNLQLQAPTSFSVESTWIQPTFLDVPVGSWQYTWIGIGGTSQSNLLQAGIGVYRWLDYPWGDYVMVPFYQAISNNIKVKEDYQWLNHISPGDTIHARISSISLTQWSILVEDITKGTTWTNTVSFEPGLNSVEWIHEPGAMGGGIAYFSPIHFSQSTYVINSNTYNLGDQIAPSNSEVQKFNFPLNGQNPLTSTSGFDSNGNFDISYLGTGSIQSDQAAVLSLHSNADLQVYDSLGNHLGVDSISGQIELGIPHSIYLVDQNGAETACIYGSGQYTIKVIGNSTGDFHLHMVGYSNGSKIVDNWQNETITSNATRDFSVSVGTDSTAGFPIQTLILILGLTIPIAVIIVGLKKRAKKKNN